MISYVILEIYFFSDFIFKWLEFFCVILKLKLEKCMFMNNNKYKLEWNIRVN